MIINYPKDSSLNDLSIASISISLSSKIKKIWKSHFGDGLRKMDSCPGHLPSKFKRPAWISITDRGGGALQRRKTHLCTRGDSPLYLTAEKLEWRRSTCDNYLWHKFHSRRLHAFISQQVSTNSNQDDSCEYIYIYTYIVKKYGWVIAYHVRVLRTSIGRAPSKMLASLRHCSVRDDR